MKNTFFIISLAAVLLIFSSTAWAMSGPFFVGGGIITEGKGANALKITFAINACIDDLQQPAGHLEINFHNTNYDAIDNSTFVSMEISTVNFSIIDTPSRHYFSIINAIGKFNNLDGWQIQVNSVDYGVPNVAKKYGTFTDSIRIILKDPYGNLVYDTSYVGEYPDEQGARTLLDGGDVTAFDF